MRYKLLVIFVILVFSGYARELTESEAKRVALEFFNNSYPHSLGENLQMVYDGETATTRAGGAEPAFYVFGNPQGKGFVIVSGDDVANPILGYSHENAFPQGNLPSHVQSWLESMKLQINGARAQGVTSSTTTRSPLTRIGEVVVKLETAQWGQDKPFNLFTPRVGFSQTPAGCGITAAAIIMHYHKWPAQGNGIIPEYQTETHKIKRPAIELGHVYNWDVMLSNYSGYYTTQQAEEVAQLMGDLGTMFQADYVSGATSITTTMVGETLPIYMDYDKSALTRDRYLYTDEEWHAMMKNELDQHRPIFYFGSNWYAGHAFVLDGYTTDSYYSVNWGWNGVYNGWFLLDALKPEGNGTGGNNDHYNYFQGAITDLKPNQGGTYTEVVRLGRGLSTSTDKFVTGEPFTIVTREILNYGSTTFEGPLLWALTDREGNIKAELLTDTIVGLHPGWECDKITKECTINVPIEYGDRIRLFYRSMNASEWSLMKGGKNCRWEILVADEYSIQESTSVTFDKVNRTLTVEMMEGVKVEIYDEKGKSYDDLRVNLNDKMAFLMDGLPAGTYLLKLSNQTQSHEVRIKLGIPVQK